VDSISPWYQCFLSAIWMLAAAGEIDIVLVGKVKLVSSNVNVFDMHVGHPCKWATRISQIDQKRIVLQPPLD
jgi:hypothetical protein